MNQPLRARSSAKINLTLDITGLRPNGYHELRSVVHTVGLWDGLEMEFLSGGEDEFSCSVPELESPGNLCLKAVRLWRENFGAAAAIRLHLEKRIPMGAGMGGGSGNAAAVLLMLAKATRRGSSEEIRNLAARLGADVPLFLQGGAVLMEGIGEVLSPLNPLPLWAVIVKPDFGMSTPAVYRAWDDGSFETRGDTQALLENWPPAAERMGGHIGNDLERAAEALGFDLAKWLGPLREVKALGCGMTGSGSAVFGLFEDETTAEAANRAVSERLAKDVHNKPFSNYCVPFTTRGVEIL